MPESSAPQSLPTLGIIGFGAFGQLMARHLGAYFRLYVHDPVVGKGDRDVGEHVTFGDLAEVAACPIVVLATPVGQMEAAARAIAPHLRPGALVLDVGSVKVVPARIMNRLLPQHVDIVATHPLFGPQSARDGINGLKIAVCPVRGQRARRVSAFLRRALKLEVFPTTPEAHDFEVAAVQGLTHLIAKILVQMEPLPRRMTTRSFELLMAAVDMVRHDAPNVFEAIERSNPFVGDVRRRFFDLAAALDGDLAAEGLPVALQHPRLQEAALHPTARACPVALQQDGEYGSKAVRQIFQQTLVLQLPHACGAPLIAEQGETS